MQPSFRKLLFHLLPSEVVQRNPPPSFHSINAGLTQRLVLAYSRSYTPSTSIYHHNAPDEPLFWRKPIVILWSGVQIILWFLQKLVLLFLLEKFNKYIISIITNRLAFINQYSEGISTSSKTIKRTKISLQNYLRLF